MIPFSCAASSASMISRAIRKRLGQRNRSLRQPIGQRFAVHELEDQKLRSVGFFETVNAGNVRMIQRGQQLRFALEPSDPFGILGERCGQALDRHAPIEAGIASAIDLAHAARTQSRFNFIRTDPRARLNHG